MKFAEILLLAVIVSGMICLLDLLFWRKKRTLKEPVVVEYARSFFPVLLLVFVLRSFLAEPFRIPSGSMKPTLLEGDFIVVNKFQYGIRVPILNTTLIKVGTPKRGDVIVFRHTREQDLIKRVIGLPGDHIKYQDDILYINGEPVPQEFISKAVDRDLFIGFIKKVNHKKEMLPNRVHDIFLAMNGDRNHYEYEDVIVPESSYFVLGDNRPSSRDSRFWGFVEDKDIYGRAFATWLSWDSGANDVRWNRFAKKIE